VKTRCLALVLLITSVALAQVPSATPKATAGPSAKSQATPPTAPATPTPTSKPAAVPAPGSPELTPETKVLTIDGLCETKTAKGECKTVMTRAQFDKLVTAFFGDQPEQGPVPAQAKRRLATQLVHNKTFAKLAEKQNLEKTPEYQQLLDWVKLQVLAELERRSVQKKSEPTAEEIDKYYNDNQERYTELALNRLMIPLHGGPDSKMTEADLQKLADDMHQKLVGGGDFKTLQAQVYDKLGMKNPPETKLTLKPNEISASQQAVKQLKPAELSSVIKDGNGLYIYKLDSKKVAPLDDKLKAEIRKTLSPQKFKKAMDDLDASVTADYNTDYFGPAQPAGPGPGRPPMMAPKPPTPPAAAKPPVSVAPPAVTAKPSTPPAASATPAGK